MNEAIATIRWKTYKEGGREHPLKVGMMYYPHISIDGMDECDSWSICFMVNPIDENKMSKIHFSMLADNEDAKRFFANFRVGSKFVLTEGHTVVASGEIEYIM